MRGCGYTKGVGFLVVIWNWRCYHRRSAHSHGFVMLRWVLSRRTKSETVWFAIRSVQSAGVALCDQAEGLVKQQPRMSAQWDMHGIRWSLCTFMICKEIMFSCLDQIHSQDNLELEQLGITPCAHYFCLPCLSQQVERNGRCGVCRHPLKCLSSFWQTHCRYTIAIYIYVYHIYSI